MNKTEIVHEVKEAIEVLRLNKVKMADVARRKETLMYGIIFIAVPTVLNLFLTGLSFPSGFGAIFTGFVFWSVLIPVLSYAATAFLVSLLAEKVFHGKGDHVGFFKIIAYASVVLWPTVAAFALMALGLVDAWGLFGLVNLLGGLWILYVTYNALMEHHKLDKEKAVYVVIAAVIIMMVVQSVLAKVLVGVGYRWY